MTTSHNRPCIRPSDRDSVIVVKVVFFSALASSLMFVSYQTPWEGQLRITDAVYVLRLPASSLWHPPHVPDYQVFARSFDRLPRKPLTEFTIERHFLWELFAFTLLFWVWLAMSLAGILYLGTCKCSDFLLHGVLYSAVGLSIGAVCCLLTWLMIGGWGAPVPLAFAILGLACGAVVARRTLPRTSQITLSSTP